MFCRNCESICVCVCVRACVRACIHLCAAIVNVIRLAGSVMNTYTDSIKWYSSTV